jgi:hypothetical protein
MPTCIESCTCQASRLCASQIFILNQPPPRDIKARNSNVFGRSKDQNDLNFVATALGVAETGKSRVFSQIVGTFFLLWFFPVGIWIIQPKINRLYQEHNVPR